jgi:hypothetical protein
MAKYILTFGTDRFTGSRGGATFQKAGVTFVIRKRSVPVQKKSPQQTAKQNTFASVAQRWRELSPAEKLSFINETPNYIRTDSLGNPYELSGQQLQSSSNLNLIINDLPPITTLPAASSIPAITGNAAGVVLSAQIAAFAYTPDPVPAGVSLQIFVSRPVSQGTILTNITDLKLLVTYPGGSSPGSNEWNAYTALFGNINNTAGMLVYYFGRYIQESTGQTGPISQEFTEIIF